ncbi:MAG: DUF1565 domain-containing protein [Candidatus Coatesbacteria bacterium]|nr:DUF1565 domain-containing protein [Candidatus Coatesbacteria bacterium]
MPSSAIYWRCACYIALAISLSCFAPLISNGEPFIVAYTDGDSYQLGDTLSASLSGGNTSAGGMSVAVYAGFLTPDGVVYTAHYDGWRTSIEPWISDIFVPQDFMLDRTVFWSLDLPCDSPQIREDGLYCFVAALARSQTADWLSISYAPFNVGSSAPSDFYVNAETGDNANDGSEAAPWRTITHALESVSGSEASPITIHVMSGEYSASSNGETYPLNMKSWVSICGEGAESTVLDAEDAAYHVIYCDGVHDLTIEGMTIKGGKADGSGIFDQIGAGILLVRLSSPLIRDNLLLENESVGSGGAIYSSDCSMTIESNTLRRNVASGSGGAIFCYLGSPEILNNTCTGNTASYSGGAVCCFLSSPTIVGNTVANNRAEGELFAGGGIYCQDCTGSIRDNAVIQNISFDSGGGIAWWGTGAVEFRGNTISDNVSNGRGGGLYLNGAVSVLVTDNVIENNSADDVGGGIFCDGTSATIQANTISGNSTSGAGGGIMLWGLSGPFSIDNNTLEYNTAAASGGGIFCLESYGALTQNTIANNTCPSDGAGVSCHGGLVNIEHNRIESNATSAGFGEGGGGISLNSCSPTIQNNTIIYNEAFASGGGIFVSWFSSPVIQKNEISYNHAAYGGAIFVDLTSTPAIEDNTMTGNLADNEGPDVYYETPPEEDLTKDD